MIVDTVLALIHSPLVGPLTWSLVAAELKAMGIRTVVPTLSDGGTEDQPFWERHAVSAAREIERVAPDAAIVLIGHSGAGALLPAIRERLQSRIIGYLFVDAGLPKNGLSRIEMMEEEDSDFARSFREYLNDGEAFPNWTDDDLRGVVPNPEIRRGLIQELRPRDRSFFTEPIPTFTNLPDAPCGYVRLSAAYDVPFRQARERGWPWRELDGGHFQMLVEPDRVVGAMLDVIREMDVMIGSQG
jgi:hypothetical protein